MKITDIRCYLIEEPWGRDTYRWRAGLPGSGDGTPDGEVPHSAVLRVDTEAGITGCVKWNRGDAVASLVKRRLKKLIGEDALLTERLWHKVWEIDRVEEMQLHHMALLDLALWDIKSRAANMPLWKMLGGNDRAVPAYASTVTWDTMEEYERHIKECMDEGFTAFKLHAWGDAKEDAKLSRNLRKWTGPDAVLMFDGSAGWDYVTSLWFGRVLEEAGFYWYEEPMREFELRSYTKLCESLDIPVLACETSDGAHWNAATWIQDGALDMMRTNPNMKAGLTGALKIAHLAECHGMKAQVHGQGHAHAQLCAAIPNNDYYEELVISSQQIRGLKNKSNDLVIENGILSVPDEPGLGYTPDWAWLEKTAVAIV
jgi:L-alanine-DL-glutamate epimerase-like enolase superfamily enzyme